MVKLTVLLSIFYFFSEMVQQYETQYYKVIKNLKKAEIRYYPPSMKIKSNRDNAFSILFSYISGNNVSGKKIAMTTPVYTNTNKGKKMMEFVLPRNIDKKNLPEPLSDKVEIFESEPGYFLSYKFGGFTMKSITNKAVETLKNIAKSEGIKIDGPPLVLVYNSPYKIFNRRNEILFRIKYHDNKK